jgi:hypothetical protein
VGLTPKDRFIKNEAYNPTKIDNDAIEGYIPKPSQPGGLRGLFGICECGSIPSLQRSEVATWLMLLCRTATERNVRDNKESAQTKLKLPVLAVGSRDFIGKEVKKRKEYVERTQLRPPAGRRVSGVAGEDLLGTFNRARG